MLDASVLLAYSRNETGVEQVRDALAAGATTSAVNWSETLTRLATVSALSAATLDQQLRTQGFAGDLLIIVPLVHDDAVLAAELRASTRHLGLSLADRCCLATALRLNRPVLTADRAWAELSIAIPIDLIR